MTCPTYNVTSRDLSLTIPGGITLDVQYPGVDPPTQIQLALQMMAQTSSATAPMAPLFNMINLSMALVEFAQSVPSLVIDPPAVAEAIVKVVENAAKVAQIVPALSVPAFVVGMIDVLLSFLAGAVEELQKQQAFESRITAARQVMEQSGNTALQTSIDCAEQLLASQRANFDEAISGAGGFITMINSMGSSIGLPTVSDIGDIPGDLSDAIDALEVVVTALQGIRQMIPV